MSINRLLALDAATCAAMGLLLMLLSEGLAPLLGLPQALLGCAGVILLPIALFMAALALMRQPPAVGVWLVILGNIAWVIASVAVIFALSPNALGLVFVLVQALVVALLAWAEQGALKARPGAYAS